LNTKPATAAFTAKVYFHEMLEAYVHFEGAGDTTRRLHDSARHVQNMNAKLHHLALYNTSQVLGAGPAFEAVMIEGCTYASAARQICAKLQGEAA
jgi:hypothetical protein